jgi:hypothetical protein
VKADALAVTQQLITKKQQKSSLITWLIQVKILRKSKENTKRRVYMLNWEKELNINEVKEIRTRTTVYFGCGAIQKINDIAKK